MSEVDIIMATNNAEQYVAEQIESILWQDYTNWHLYILDDCSEDKTFEILKAYARKETRISVVSESADNAYTKTNFMHLLECSKAPYLMFCNQDGVWLPDKVQKTIGRMRQLEADGRGEDPLLVFSDMAIVDEELELVNPSFTRVAKLRPEQSELYQVVAMPIGACCTFMINRPLVKLMLEHAFVDDIDMPDWWATLCAAAFGSISYIDEPLSLFRMQSDGVIGVSSVLSTCSAPHNYCEKRSFRSVGQVCAFRNAYSEMLDAKDLDWLDAFICTASYDTSMGGSCSQKDTMLEAEKASNWPASGYSITTTASIEVACGIVTFEPNIERLHENLQSIASQVSRIYIYDNGSSNVDEIIRCLEEVRQVAVIPVLSSKNTGMSIALNSLSAMALRDGFQYILLLDQDSIATEDMVSNLVSQVGAKRAMVCPLLSDRNNEHLTLHGEVIRTIKRAATSGSLLYLPAFVDAGGYDERLFVDWVDFEFCDNLRNRGWQIVQTSNAVLIHEVGHQEPVFRGPGRDNEGTKHVNRMFYRTNHPAWRVEDRARSQVITMRKYLGTRIFLEEAYLFARMTVARCLVLEKRKLALAKAIARGVKRGLFES